VRVLILAEADLGHTGSGAERVLANHAYGLVARGHEVTVVTGGRRGSERGRNPEVIGIGWSLSTPWRARAVVHRVLASRAADVLIVHHPYPALATIGAARRAGIPSAYVYHSPWADEFAGRRAGVRGPGTWAGRALRLLVERHVARAVDRMLPLSEFMARRVTALHGVPRGAILVVPGGVDRERFAPVRDRALARTRLGLLQDGPLLLSVRNLEPRMGLDTLVRAVPAVRARHPEASLVIAGDGPLRGELEQLARTLGVTAAVRCPGFVPEDDLPLLYASADVFVLPSIALEGFGLVTLEALACGTPVIGSRVGATPEILGPLDSALLLDEVSPPAIARTVLAFLERPDRAALGARCRARTAAYDWRAVVADLDAALVSLRGGAP
jgi:glycosyltransferase involved in cell wall biosynthesis